MLRNEVDRLGRPHLFYEEIAPHIEFFQASPESFGIGAEEARDYIVLDGNIFPRVRE
jgi:hypothetical protein